MSALRLLWLVLAVLGAGLAVGQGVWLGVWQAYGNSTAFGPPVAVVTLTCFALAETYVRKNWEALLAIPAAALLGIGCGLPLYLFLRSAPIR